MIVELGNPKAVQQRTADDGSTVAESLDGERVTYINIPNEDVNLSEAFTTITDPRGAWGAHAAQGDSPSWVYSDNAALQMLLAQHFGCVEGRPDNVEATHHTLAGPPGVGPDGPVNKDGSVKASSRAAKED